MKKLLSILFIVLCQFSLSAQSPQQFLYQGGKVDSLFSETLNEYRTIFIQLPDGYIPGSNQKYPVAFILDGEIQLPTVAVVHQFYSGGFMPEMILVGIDNSKNRTRDLTPTKITSKYGMPFNEETGGANDFIIFLEKELIPHIAKNYPATEYRTFIGHSYGGLLVTYTLLNYPGLFDNYLAIDPSLDWDDQVLLSQASKIKKNEFSDKSLYISLSGQLHMQDPGITIDNVMDDQSDFTLFARSNIGFSNLMKEQKESGLTFQWEFFSKDIHGTVAVPSMRNGLTWMFEWFQMEQTDKFNTPETSADELLEIIRYRADKLKNHFGYDVPPYEEGLMNMSGYMSMDMGQLERAKMFFTQAIAYFPDSPNVYDSMADYYIQTDNYSKALEYVTKAYELSGATYYKERMQELRKK
jgi:predicted alpha/beta superfamily hydrolase